MDLGATVFAAGEPHLTVSATGSDLGESAANLGIAMLRRALNGQHRLAPGDTRGETLLLAALRQLERALPQIDDTPACRPLWIRVRENLADALSCRPWRHDVADEEAARTHLEAVLAVATREGHPAAKRRANHNLGVLYQNRDVDDPADNLERAVRHLEAALQTDADVEEDLDERARTLSQLGNTYHQRLRGDRADNVERSLSHYQDALAIRSWERDPVGWGITQHNLGVLYRSRPTGDREDNVRASVRYLNQALTVRTREEHPEFWAMTLRELGTSKLALSGEQSAREGAQYLTQALDIYSLERAPSEWSLIQFELAVAAQRRGDESEAEAILAAVLELPLERDRPLLWARVALLTGKLRFDLAAQQRDEHKMDDALRLMRAGVGRLLSDGDLSAGRGGAIELANRLLAVRRFRLASVTYLAALKADAQQYAASLSLASRGREISESQDVAGRAALALVYDKQLTRAVEVLERSRGRLLGEALARDRADLQALLGGDSVGQAAATRYLAAAARVRDLEDQERQHQAGTLPSVG